MGRPLNYHWDLWILNPVPAPIRAIHQTMEVNIFKSASTMDTISKRGDGTNAEPMESRGKKVTGTVKEIFFIRTYLKKRPDPL